METIKKTEDFTFIYNKGEKIHTKYSLIFKKKKTNHLFGFIASKKIGNAIVRNRLKRLFREVVRKNMDKFSPNCAYILIAKKKCSQDFNDLNFNLIENDIILGLKRYEKRNNKNNKNISKNIEKHKKGL